MSTIEHFLEQVFEAVESPLYEDDIRISLLKSLKTQANEDNQLTDDEKLNAEQVIERFLIQILNRSYGGDASNAGVAVRELPSDYGNIASASIKSKKGVSIFNPDGLPFAIWFKDVYLPKFHPMPMGYLQYPILTATALINPNAVLQNEEGEWINKLVYGYFLGLRGSGKSTLARQILKLYPKHLRLETDVSFTGASMRDDLSPMCKRNKPAIMLYDNLNPAESYRALGRHYNLFLQNEKAHCISKISGGGENNEETEFHFYCMKLVTSIFDLEFDKDPKSGEILRRFLVFCFEKASPDESYSGYSWSEFEDHYYQIWTDTPKISEVYFPTLLELESMSPKHAKGIDPAMWDLIKMPIATGVMLDIWSNVWEAIGTFEHYFASLPTLKKTAVKDILSQCVHLYVTTYYPNWIESNQSLYPDLNADVIRSTHLYDYITSYGLRVNDKDKKEIIPQLLSDYGYSSKLSSKELLFTR